MRLKAKKYHPFHHKAETNATTRLRFIGRLTVLVSLFICTLSAPAQKHEPNSLPAGSMTPYDLTQDEGLAMVAGDSLKPVMINYVARHGARFLSSQNKVSDLRAEMLKAKQYNSLTRQGSAFLQLLDNVENTTAQRWGALDSLGVVEEETLARQMVNLCPDLLKQGRVEAIATYVPRVVKSMYVFCHSLCSLSPDLQISTSEGKCYDSLLRFFDTDTLYSSYLKKGKWKGVYNEFVRQNVPEAPAHRLVGNAFGVDSQRYRKISLDMYAVLQSMRATGIAADYKQWMTEDEYERCWQAANLKHYLQRTATDISAIPDSAARPLLRSLIASMDKAGSDNAPVADLRFAHAETLMPLFSLMQLPECRYSATDNYASVRRYWKDSDVVPLGANLLIVSLKSPSGEIYVCMRLNGKWVAPMRNGKFLLPYRQLRSFWLSKL